MAYKFYMLNVISQKPYDRNLYNYFHRYLLGYSIGWKNKIGSEIRNDVTQKYDIVFLRYSHITKTEQYKILNLFTQTPLGILYRMKQ